MDFLNINNIGKAYKDFVVVSIEDLPECKSKAVYLRHRITGLEVYHLINDDKENLFSFCFRTVAKNSKGAAHITEHSVLCGSEKFPLKEPFNTLDQQSLKTFLNAMTYPEKTLYPAASVVKSDYYNLMDVYADAVFFPELSRQTFMQEGWRLELDENEKASIQGVVYNEMKANYSTFTSVAVDKTLSAMYPDSIMDYDSGGDPIDIPSLSYEEFVDFHKKFYCPSNCLIFLYGNIPTKEQLDFLDEKYIPRLIKTYGSIENLDVNSEKPYVADDIRNIQTYRRIPETTEIHEIAPDNGASGNMVAEGFYLGPNSVEHSFLAEVLCGNDSSPMTKKIKASKLGEDEAPVNGNFGYVQDDCICCFGLSGVKKSNIKKVYKLIEDSIKEIYEEGIPQEDINSAIMAIDFVLREQNRSYGPPSISIMSRAAASWSIGEKPSKLLNRIRDFEKVKEVIRKNPDYIKHLIKKYFIDADVVLKISVEPSKKYFEERTAKEAENLKILEKKINKKQLKQELADLHEYQNKKETEEELKCIPHLSLKDIDSNVGQIHTEYFTVKGSDNCDVPVLMNIQNTNGIIYLNVSYPFDNLKPEQLKYMELFSSFCGSLGWNGKNWADCIQEEAQIFGDFGTRFNYNAPRNSEDAKRVIETYPNKNVANRCYFSYCAKFLNDQTEKAFNLASTILETCNFEDLERSATLLNEDLNDISENFVYNASKYVSFYSKCSSSIDAAMKEIMHGITEVMNYKSLSEKDLPEILKEFGSIYRSLKNQGAVIHVICDENDRERILKLLPDFAIKAGITELKQRDYIPLDDYLKVIYKPDNYNPKDVTYIKASAQAGYASMQSKCSGELTEEIAAETILSVYLNGHQLWEKIRMQGGAYGGRCSSDGRSQLFTALSWRDPTPDKTVNSYLEILKEAASFEFSQEDVERCILSEYSEYIVPDSPVGYGNRGFNRYVSGYNNEQFKKEIELLRKVTPEAVHEAAVRLYKYAEQQNVKVVFCDNSLNCCGNIIKIPL